jgi:hypothetical protein
MSSLITILFGMLALYCAMLIPSATHINSRAGEGFEEDINARMEWELKRLRDPRTGKIPDDVRARELQFAKRLPRRENDKQPLLLSNTFQPIGPGNIGGRTRALAIDIRNEQIMISGGVSGGIWRSINAGTTWTKVTTPDIMHNVTTIVQDTRTGKENTWYAGTGEIWGNSSQIAGTGAYKSTDNGLTWQSLKATYNSTQGSFDSPYEYVWRMIVDHTNANQDVVLMANALGSIARSTDGGTTWRNVLGSFGSSQGYFTDIAIAPSGVMYATISQETSSPSANSVKGIFRSSDGGNQWTKIDPSFMPAEYGRIVIGIAPSDERQVYFLAHTPGVGFKQVNFNGDEDWNSLWKYTYVSGNGAGANGTWENRSENIPGFKPTLGQFGDYDAQSGYNMLVKVKPNDPNTVFIGGTNLYRSTDGFTTKTKWSWIAGYGPGSALPFYEVYPNNHPDQHELIFSRSNPNIMFGACDGGIFRCDDNSAQQVRWASLNNGYNTTQFYTCAIPQTKGDNTVIGGLQDNGTVFTNQRNGVLSQWTMPGLGDGSFCAISQLGSERLYVMSRQQGRIGKFELSPSGDVLKYALITPKGTKRDDYIFINPFALDPNNQSLMYLPAGRMLWRNNDITKEAWGKWDTTNTSTVEWDSLPATKTADKISAIAVSTKPSNIVYYGTQEGDVLRLGSADKGNPTPVSLTNALISAGMTPGSNVECIAINPRSADSVFVVYSNYNVQSVFFSSNGGTSWTAVGGNIELLRSNGETAPSCRWLEITEVNGQLVYLLGTSTGLYSTTYLNGNRTVWIQEASSTIGTNIVTMIDSRSSDNTVAVATHGNGMFIGTYTSPPTAPSSFNLVSPANNQLGIQLGARFNWTQANNAEFYQVEVARDSLFTTDVQQTVFINRLTDSLGNLQQDYTNYYWRAYAVGAGGITRSAQTWKFTTAIRPPELVSPIANAVQVPTTTTLVWNAVRNAKEYRVELSSSVIFSTGNIQVQTVTDTMATFANLDASKRYFWRVLTRDSAYPSVYSERRSFTTAGTSSVQENDDLRFSLNVYPNPTTDNATLTVNAQESSQLQIRLLDMRGSEVASIFDGFQTSGTTLYRINTASISQGRYNVELRSGRERKILPLIIHR